MLINISDLLTSGIGFSIVNEDADFAEDGELTSCRTIVDENYIRGGGERTTWDNAALKWVVVDPAPESEPLTDTTELNDDSDRWGHIKDSHIAEMLAEAHTLSMPFSGRLHGEYGYHQLKRTRRTAKLLGYIRKLRLYRNKQRNNTILARIKRGVWQRYAASIKLIVERNQQEWWLLYLTRKQVDTINEAVHKAIA